jgi:hypothetical protein
VVENPQRAWSDKEAGRWACARSLIYRARLRRSRKPPVRLIEHLGGAPASRIYRRRTCVPASTTSGGTRAPMGSTAALCVLPMLHVSLQAAVERWAAALQGRTASALLRVKTRIVLGDTTTRIAPRLAGVRRPLLPDAPAGQSDARFLPHHLSGSRLRTPPIASFIVVAAH